MILFLVNLFLCFNTGHASTSTLQETIGQQYKQMSYLPINSILTQFNTNSKQTCIALCSRLVFTCNIAVFQPSLLPRCILYRESFAMTRLAPSTDTTVVNFGRNVSNEGCFSKTGLTAMSTYGLITLEDLSVTSGVQNRAIICGSLVSSNSADFAKSINTGVFPATTYSLEINKQLTSGNPLQVLAGSFALGTNSTHTITTSNNISYTVDGRTVLIQGGGKGAKVVADANLTARCTAMINDLEILSNTLANMINISANYINIPFSPGPLIFYVNQVDTNGMAVFSIDGNTALNNGFVQIIEINVNSSIINDVQLVVINLSGTNINFAQGNFGGTWLNSATTGQARTLWNLYQATSFGVTRAWSGAILAPYASVNTASSVNGAVAVKALTTSAEICNPSLTVASC